MGVWGVSLFSNDTACDVRDTYINFLKKKISNQEAYHKTCEEYAELIGTDEEAVFWLSLAVVQWETGRLMMEVKDKALEFIDKRWSDIFDRLEGNISEYEEELQRVKEKIQLPMPPEKKFRKQRDFISNPWNIGDIYAYEFHCDEYFSGKYILFQKIGNVEYYKDKIFSVVQIFNKIFDEIPIVDDMENLKILPLIDSPGVNGTPDSIDEYTPSFEWLKKATMLYEKKSDYPEKYFTYIGNKTITGVEYKSSDCTDFYLDKNAMDEWIIDYYRSWYGKDDIYR